MPEIILTLKADNSQVSSALQDTADDLNKVGATAKKTNTEVKKGFDEVAASAKKANDEMANPKPTKNQRDQLTAIQALKKDIRDFTNAALAAGEGTKEFAKNIRLAGEAKASLKDLQKHLAALDPNRVAGAFLGLGQSIAGAFTVAQSAVALTGEKNEDLEKTLLKVQAAQGLLAGLQSLANTQDELAKIKIIALNKLNTAQITLQGAAESKNIIIRNAATAAQYALNAAMSLGGGGVLLLVGSIVALGTALVRLIPSQESATEAQERLTKEFEKTKEVTGQLISNQDAYVDLLKSQGKTEDEINKARSVAFTLKKQQIEDELDLNNRVKEGFVSQLKEQLEEQKDYDNLSLREDIKATKDKIEEIDNKNKVLILKQQELFIKQATDAAKDAKEKADKEKADNDKALQRREEFYRLIEELRKRANQAEIEGLTGTERIKAQEKQQLEDLAAFRKQLESKGKLNKEQLEQLAIIENQIRSNANKDLLALQESYNNQRNAAQAEADQSAIDAANAYLTESEKALEESNKAKILLTEEGSEARLNAEIKAVEELRDFQLENYELSKDQRVIIEQEALQKIQDLRTKFSEKKEFNLFKLLGLEVSEQEKQQIQNAARSLFNATTSLLKTQLDAEQDALDKRKKINDEIINNSDKRINDLESQLDRELELNKRGFASNVSELQKKLAEEKAAKQAALEEEKRIADEQEKIKRRQAVIDAITQGSQLLSAGATLFAQGAFKGPVGIITAIATIASMIASFAALNQKLKAGFKDGGYTGEYGENEIAGVVHGKEYVATAKTTKKHRPLLEALNSEDYSRLTDKDILPLLEGTGVSLKNDVIKRIVVSSEENKTSKALKENDLSNGIRSLNKNFNKFFEHYKNSPKEHRRADGALVVKKGNTITVIKNG